MASVASTADRSRWTGRSVARSSAWQAARAAAWPVFSRDCWPASFSGRPEAGSRTADSIPLAAATVSSLAPSPARSPVNPKALMVTHVPLRQPST